MDAKQTPLVDLLRLHADDLHSLIYELGADK